jgi:hypothetical protein
MKYVLVFLPLLAAGAFAQTEIKTTITANQGAKAIAIIVPRPDTALPLEAYNAPFFAPLTRDLSASSVFALTPYPPNVPIDAELAKRVNAQFILLT